MDTLKENIEKIIKITKSEDIKYNITMQLAEIILFLQEKEFNRGLNQGIEMTKNIYNNLK